MKKLFTMALVLAAGLAVNAQSVTPAMQDDGETSNFNWTEASSFAPIAVSDGVYEAMGGKIKTDLRVDDVTKHMWLWSNTYVAGDGSGINSFGEVADHISLVVQDAGWSGLGIVSDNPVDFSFLDDSWHLHFGIKGDPTQSQAFMIANAKFAVGDAGFVDNGTTYPSVGTYQNDGEWYFVDMPYSALKRVAANGIIFPAADGGEKAFTSNYFVVLSGGKKGYECHIDNIFFYQSKSAAAGIETAGVAKDDKSQTVYDVLGRRVSDMSRKGLYIVKQGNETRKILVK